MQATSDQSQFSMQMNVKKDQLQFSKQLQQSSQQLHSLNMSQTKSERSRATRTITDCAELTAEISKEKKPCKNYNKLLSRVRCAADLISI